MKTVQTKTQNKATTTTPARPEIVGKEELVHQVAARSNTNLTVVREVIEAFTEVVQENITNGRQVRIMGFGTWELRQRSPRSVKSIRGGQTITIPAHHHVGFSAGAILAAAAQQARFDSTHKK